jgi:hypothetical protein
MLASGLIPFDDAGALPQLPAAARMMLHGASKAARATIRLSDTAISQMTRSSTFSVCSILKL